MKIYFIINKLKTRIRPIVYWDLPNIIPNINDQISKASRKRPKCAQLTKVTGAGRIFIGEDCKFGFKLGGGNYCGVIELQPRYKNSLIRIGNKVATNNNVFLCSAKYIEIGNSTRIGQNVTIMDHEAHDIDPLKRSKIGGIGEVIIGENVWIGNNVVILKDTVIGKNTIVAAGAIVKGNFPENVIIGGVPAKVLKKLEIN
ncbi:transferase family hexapeptide repeat protein [Pontibacter virosus]|uniref:Transferase family hexapeptide repeat protein n=2 Tax=Pontibacter virosus TaxID=1765052 RepID=A0A2U1B2X6_9BACT|nr:transferase family hexapeptide repeat protein [Pontibacter virosus]